MPSSQRKRSTKKASQKKASRKKTVKTTMTASQRKRSTKKASQKKASRKKTVSPKKQAVKTIGTKSQVWKGSALKTAGGLTKNDIKRVKQPKGTYRYISKTKSQTQKGNPWVTAVSKARKQLGITGFLPVKKPTGAPKTDSEKLYVLAKEIYEA